MGTAEGAGESLKEQQDQMKRTVCRNDVLGDQEQKMGRRPGGQAERTHMP